MSQISRRNFMKCAGAAALAIAASGILTGCDNTLDVEVTFVYNGEELPLRGTGKVAVGEQYMDTATVVLPAEYQAQYEAKDKKVEVVRVDNTRKAMVELVAKSKIWTVSYRLGDTEVLPGTVKAAAVDPTVTVNDLNKDELAELGKKFYQLPEDAKITISNGIVIVPVEKIMDSVKVEYLQWNTLFDGQKKWDKSTYAGANQTVQIWKGQSTVSTDDMTNLSKINKEWGQKFYTYKRVGDTTTLQNNFERTDKFAIDWANPVVQVYLYEYEKI